MGPLVVTNAANYRHYRSHGIVGPRQVFGTEDKYYPDFLDLCEGRLPVFRAPLPENILEFVQQGSSRVARPVILELDATSLPDAVVEGLSLEGRPITCIPGSPDAKATAPPLVLPFEAVKQIHVLDDEVKELLLRDNSLMANLRQLPEHAIQVTPEIRGETEINLDAVRAWLSDLEAAGNFTVGQFIQFDKTAGAVVLIASRMNESSEDILHLLGEGTRTGKSRIPEWILPLEESNSKSEDPDVAVYEATQSVVRRLSPNQFVPSEALADIQERLQRDALPEEDAAMLEKGFGKIGRILRNEQPFQEARSQDYPALQGLMFFMLRQSPEDLLDWSSENTNSSEDAHITSIAYSGLLYGRANLPMNYRPAELDERIARFIAKKLSPLSDCPRLHPARILDEDALEPRYILSKKIEDGEPESEGATREAVLHICKMEGWKDCVETEVIAPDRQPVSTYQTQGGGENRKFKMAWSFTGVPDVNYKLNMKRFSFRIREDEISSQTVQNALDIIKKHG